MARTHQKCDVRCPRGHTKDSSTQQLHVHVTHTLPFPNWVNSEKLSFGRSQDIQVANGYPTGSLRDKLDTCWDTSTFTAQDTQRETRVKVTSMVTKLTAIKRHFNARCLQGNVIPSFSRNYCRLFGCNAALSGISTMMTSLTLLSRFDYRHRDMRFL